MAVRIEGHRGVKFNLRVPIQVAHVGRAGEGRLDPADGGTVQAVGIYSDTSDDPPPIYTRQQ